MASDGNAEGWVQTQQKTFTKWANNHLRKKGHPIIENAATDFEDGIRLMQLINALYDLPIPKHNATPKMKPHKLDNIELAFKMLEEAKIKTNFLKHAQLVDHDLKMILGMMWSIILDYAIKGIGEGDATAKEGLLLWCRKKTAGYRDVDPPSITNFSTNWRNGLAFCALIHRHQPQLIDYDSLDKANAAENIEKAFAAAESLGIPRLLDAEDLLTERPDERSVMTQVSEYFHRFASQDVKETAARRAAKFLALTKEINNLKFDYEQQVKALLEWVQSTIDRFGSVNFGETLEDSLAVNAALREYMLNEKPQKSAEKLDVESRFAEIQTQLRVRDRPAYEVPQEFSPDTLDAAFDSLYESEKQHAKAARERRFAFVHKKEETVSEDKVAEMTESYKHFDKDADGALDRDEFRAALSAMSIPVRDDAALDALLAEVSGGAPTISLEQWMAYNTMLATDKDDAEQIKASFRTLADDGDFIGVDNLRVQPLTDEDVAYLSEAMPKSENGQLDYSAFVDASFRQ